MAFYSFREDLPEEKMDSNWRIPASLFDPGADDKIEFPRVIVK